MSIVKDPIIEKIKVLYDLGEGGQYEIVVRTIFIIDAALKMGKTSKECVDRMMDKGVKPLELGIALSVAITRINPSFLNGMDSSIRIKILRDHADMLADFEKVEAQNE